MSTYTVAKGFGIKINNKSAGAITSIGGLNVTRETEDVTTITSDSGWREFMGTYRDGGDLNIEGLCKASDEGVAELEDAALDGDDPVTIAVTFPSNMGGSWSSSAIVTAFTKGEGQVSGLLKWSATLKRSGAPTTPAAASTGTGTGS